VPEGPPFDGCEPPAGPPSGLSPSSNPSSGEPPGSAPAASTNGALLRAVLDALPDSLWLADREGCYLLANEAFSEICGRSRDRVPGASPRALWPGAFAADLERTHGQALATGRRAKSVATLEQLPEGTRWLEIFAAPLRIPGSTEVAAAGGARDITEWHRLEEALDGRTRERACLLEVAHIVQRSDLTAGELFALAAEALRRGFTEPARASVRIGIDDRSFASGPWAESNGEPTDSVEIRSEGRVRGTLEVRQHAPRGASSACLRPAEIELVEAIAGILGEALADRERRAALADSEARLHRLIDDAPDAILVVGAGGLIRFANRAALALFDRTLEDLVDGPFGFPIAIDGPSRVEIARTLDLRHAEMRVTEIEWSGEPAYAVSLRDVTERFRYEHHIEYLATHDELTDLPNRALLRDRLNQAILHNARARGRLALLFLDVDEFKLINDNFGHAVGDALLIAVAARLQEAVRSGDTVARLGGDEFLVLLPEIESAEGAIRAAHGLHEAFRCPFDLGGETVYVTASIGVSVYPEDGSDGETLLKHADAAMYRAKELGRGQVHFYTQELSERALERLETERALRAALDDDALEVWYQPQIDLATGHIVGAEALLRWPHPEHGFVSPARFVPVAERTGLIVPIGRRVLGRACAEAVRWHRQGFADLRVAVNVSARQIWQRGIVDAIGEALAASGLPPDRLELEITETVALGDIDDVIEVLAAVRALGAQVTIDDFGTGYSSLGYLRRLPLDRLKLDRAFVRDLECDPLAEALAAGIVRIARTLDLAVVAEGVETAAQARMLARCGCEALQGYLFSPALPPERFAELLSSGRRLEIGSP